MEKEKIEEVLTKYVEPMLSAHGGGVELVSVEGDVVTVRLKGACAGCFGAQMTLTNLVERTLKEHLPEVEAVKAVP